VKKTTRRDPPAGPKLPRLLPSLILILLLAAIAHPSAKVHPPVKAHPPRREQ